MAQDTTNYGAEIKARREAAGISGVDLSERLGWRPEQLWRRERGETLMNTPEFLGVCQTISSIMDERMVALRGLSGEGAATHV